MYWNSMAAKIAFGLAFNICKKKKKRCNYSGNKRIRWARQIRSRAHCRFLLTLGKQLSAGRDTNDFLLVGKIVVRVCKQTMSNTNATAIFFLNVFSLSHNIITYYSHRIEEQFWLFYPWRKSTEGYPASKRHEERRESPSPLSWGLSLRQSKLAALLRDLPGYNRVHL